MRPVTLVAAVLALALAGSGWAATPPSVRASAPRAVGFADELEYVVEATVPAEEADRARIVAEVGAFTVVETAPLEQEARGDAVVLRLRRTLACLEEACLGPRPSKAVVLPPPRVSSAFGSARGAPTTVGVRGRITAKDVSAGPAAYRRDSATPPKPDGPGPGRVAAGLAVLAVLTSSSAVAVLLPWRRRRPAPRDEDPFARAIRLVRESAGRSSPDRRRAAGLLARLAGDRDGRLGTSATRVAWSPPEPSAADVQALARQAAGDRG